MTESAFVVSTVAGCSEPGFADGIGINTKFNCPRGLAFSKTGGILVADRANHCIRKVTITGYSPAHVETFAGVHGQLGYRDGEAAKALFNGPRSLSVSDDGTVYVTDTDNHRIRTIDNSKIVRTLAGSDRGRVVDGKGEDASFFSPFNITWIRGGGLLVCGKSCVIRHVTEDGIVSSVAGTPYQSDHENGELAQAKFSNVVVQIAFSGSGQKVVADENNHAIRVIDSDGNGVVRTIAGGNQSGFQDGPIGFSKFNSPRGVAVGDDGQIFVADCVNHRIRMISSGIDGEQVVSTVAGCSEKGLEDGPGTTAKLQTPCFLLLDHATNTLYFTQDHCLRKISLSKKQYPSLKSSSSMLHDLISLTADESNLADVVFRVEGKPVYSYKALLSVRSRYFRSMFQSGMKESASTAKPTEIPIQEVDYESFRALIVYLTTDQLTVDSNDCNKLCQLLVVSNQFNEDKLKEHCERLLVLQIQEDNVNEMVQIAERHEARILRDAALRFTSLNCAASQK